MSVCSLAKKSAAILPVAALTASFLTFGIAGAQDLATVEMCLSDDPAEAPPPSAEVRSYPGLSPRVILTCGQENTIGVRHINVGHPIPLDTDHIRAFNICVDNIYTRGANTGPGTAPNSTQYEYAYGDGKRAISSFENDTGRIITVFTANDGAQSNNWRACGPG